MKTKVYCLIIMSLLVLSSCGNPVDLQPEFAIGSQTWIDSPLEGSQLPLAPVEIVAHASSQGEIASFEIKLNGQLLAETTPDPASIDQTLMYTRYSWQPAAPGSYLIEVKAFDGNNQPGSPAQVMILIGVQETITPGTTPISLPTITTTSTLTFTETPTIQIPTFTLTVDGNCRAGPTKKHEVIISGLAGQSYPIIGRSEDGSWYLIQFNLDMNCWFSNAVGDGSGDTSPLPVFTGPPLPTDTLTPTVTPPLACFDLKDAASCNANPACVWAFALAGPGYCKEK